jgi:hypothetical protein
VVIPCLFTLSVLHVGGIQDVLVGMGEHVFEKTSVKWSLDSYRAMYDNTLKQGKLWLIYDLLHDLRGAIS